MSSKKTIFIMVDGFGIPPSGWYNSVFSSVGTKEFMSLLSRNSIQVATTMGVDGIPQSATGQTALFTGVNTASEMGMHIQGFPGPRLRGMIEENNMFRFLVKNGMKVSFANAYIKYTLEELRCMNFRSVTTVMVDSVLGWVRNMEHMLTGEAVYHDITRETIDGPVTGMSRITPEKAAEHLLGIATKNDFTLFEYFLTDRAGHRMDKEFLTATVSNLGRFVVEVAKGLGNSTSLVLTSDHGNAEDMTVRTHTKNPVPLMGINIDLGSAERLEISEVFPAVAKAAIN